MLAWHDRWLPRNAGIAALFCIAACWLVSAYFLFRHYGLSLRQKITGWICVIGVIGYITARGFSCYFWWRYGWLTRFLWDAITLLIALVATLLAALAAGQSKLKMDSTPFTVESEAPDHVLHVE